MVLWREEAELASESQKARLAREQEKARLQDLLHSVRQEKEVIAAQWARKHEGELAVLHDALCSLTLHQQCLRHLQCH